MTHDVHVGCQRPPPIGTIHEESEQSCMEGPEVLVPETDIGWNRYPVLTSTRSGSTHLTRLSVVR